MSGTPERPESFVAMQPVPEARSWAEKVASRLWMLQTSFADDPPSARHEYLVEEIERSIKDVAESRRSEYLAALMERFPGPERIDAPYFKPPEVETVERGPQEMADELIPGYPNSPMKPRRCSPRNFKPSDSLFRPATASNCRWSFWENWGSHPKIALDEERMMKLFTALLEMVVTLDHLIWNVWKNIAPKSSVRRDQGSENPRRTIGRYLSGDREVATLQITQMLDKTRQLTAGLLSAIGPAGEIFARKHLEKFAPEKIRASVESKSPGIHLERRAKVLAPLCRIGR